MRGFKYGRLFGCFLAAMSFLSCNQVAEEGVSFSLALQRTDELSDVRYSLVFDLTKESGNVISSDTVFFRASEKKAVVLDFKAPEANLLGVEANGKKIKAVLENEHLTIPRKYVKTGDNTVVVNFVAGEQSLNRRDDFLYTLLVPDRARTLFPCFDQPDLKAVFELTLNVPEPWIAVSNTEVENKKELGNSTLYSFYPTKPLSTYLFSFVAGRFERVDGARNNKTISMYHRETDPAKVAQSNDIINLVFDSMEWLEDYTGIEYPFDKYDFIVIPDFQYGGMEHAGATLYNDRRIFLSGHPTTEELMERASLIAHETAHMWFGDYVTMRWFDDVWTKEVFANWFAYRMVRPLFPSLNYTLSDLKVLYAPAYQEDRTQGSNAIRRPLDNLQDAGLIYCNIIYDKAPVVMNKLADMLGEQAFRDGLREYLRAYGYSNASWDDLVDILNRHTEADLREWSDAWIKEPGMPEYSGKAADGKLEVNQSDPLGRGIVWQQELRHEIAEGRYWIPNIDGKGYGWFRPDAGSLNYIMEHWGEYAQTQRMSLLMTLYENSWHGTLDRKSFIDWCGSNILSEQNPLILSSLISYAADESLRYEGGCPEFTDCLRSIVSDPSRAHELRLLAFRQYYKSAQEDRQLEELYSIWNTRQAYPSLELGERDFTDLACQLMVAFPDRARDIAEIQSGRITNPDRKETFKMLCLAASPDSDVRNALFASFLESAQNRRPESRVLSALALLCHRDRQEEALAYIVPSLDALEEIQRTGDIFFPGDWCSVLLKNQQNDKAAETVNGWLFSHPGINPLLATKILQALDR
ncbi:MAG: M1 family aminopeptidase [Bacteroidales bacterium]|nr:M1 family aminopeptidase [Bacteroidales bacterium]